MRKGAGRPGAAETEAARKTWLRVEAAYIINHAVIKALKKTADQAVVAVAENLQADFLVSDDIPIRRIAAQLGLDLLATVDVLVLGKRDGHLASCQAVMDKMIAAGFGICSAVYNATLMQAGEANPPPRPTPSP